MIQDKNLYFIPILAKAFKSKNQTIAFKNALIEILRLGKIPEFKKGFEQFQMFISSGIQSLKGKSEILNLYQDLILKRLLIMLASDTLDSYQEIKKLLLQRIKDDQDIAQLYENIKHDILLEKQVEPSLKLELFRNEYLIDSKPLPTRTESIFFTKIKPGKYSIKLSNGRLLWEGAVEAKDILWKMAFPDMDYPMAASTEEEERLKTKFINILDGEIELSFHAGLETGSISLILKES